MFGKRADGKRVKNLQIIDRAMPYFMPQRIDAVNLYQNEINCENLDKFILEEKKNSGVHYSYTEVLLAACVRMLYQRPKTNYFVHNGMIFQRKYISISMSAKKKLSDDGEEVTLKLFFTGRESVADVKKIFEDELAKSVLDQEDVHKTTKFAGALAKMPNWLYKFALMLIRWLDKHGALPRAILDISPFHTSVYVADLRSIKLDALYHHLYNFGNTTIFATLGKTKKTPVVNSEGEIVSQKVLPLKFSLDERVCDGLYYANSLKLLTKLIENPELLKERLPEPELTGKALKKKQKADKKASKKAAKAKKNAKG